MPAPSLGARVLKKTVLLYLVVGLVGILVAA